jgi:hypothetical protein
MSSQESNKPYNLVFEQRQGYLYAYVEGTEDSYEISRSFWMEIAAETRRLRASKVLIDENIEQNASLTDVFRLASELPQMGFGRSVVAFVDRYLDQQEVNEFGATVANNRGFHGGIFNNVEEAERFLGVSQSVES